MSLRFLVILGPVREVANVRPTPRHKAPWPNLLRGDPLVAFVLTDSQQVDITIVPTDRKGNPAQVEGGSIQWLVDNPNLLALAPSADGKTCTVAAVGPLGRAVVTVKADADLGAGVTGLVGTIDIDVTGGTATNVTLTPGAPTEQP
jgi:hypothetical protein